MSNSEFSEVRSRAPVALCDCGMAAATEIIGDRWSLLVLREAFYGVVRYDDMLADLGISRSILSDRLTKLVTGGLLEKQPYREANDRERMAYVLTARGREFAVVMLALLQWGNAEIKGGPRFVIAKRSGGGEVSVGLIDSGGKAVSPKDIAIRPKGQ